MEGHPSYDTMPKVPAMVTLPLFTNNNIIGQHFTLPLVLSHSMGDYGMKFCRVFKFLTSGHLFDLHVHVYNIRFRAQPWAYYKERQSMIFAGILEWTRGSLTHAGQYLA